MAYGIDKMCSVVKRGKAAKNVRKDLAFFRAYYSMKVKHDCFPMDALAETQALGVGSGDIALSIGGDSYCYSDAMRKSLFHQHRVFRTMGMKTVLWGCSFEEELLMDTATVEDIKSYDLITARETISYEMLKKVNPNTVLVADSAFTLKGTRPSLPASFENSGIVGINTSPLIERRESIPGLTRKNFELLIDSILNETQYNVMLIPHVVWKNNDDRTSLGALYERYVDNDRVLFVGDSNCEELKGYISCCRFFIGARTHATIAAYSSCIPTLVLGYSTKSKGIAYDLFGSYERFVLPVQNLVTETDLMQCWYWLQENEEECRGRLRSVIPEYTQRACLGREAINKL